MDILNTGKGYLSYSLAFLAIIVGVAGYFVGILDSDTAIGVVWAGLAVFGLRRAI